MGVGDVLGHAMCGATTGSRGPRAARRRMRRHPLDHRGRTGPVPRRVQSGPAPRTGAGSRRRKGAREATEVLLSSGRLTALGQRFAQTMLRTLDGLCRLPVPAEARRRGPGPGRRAPRGVGPQERRASGAADLNAPRPATCRTDADRVPAVDHGGDALTTCHETAGRLTGGKVPAFVAVAGEAGFGEGRPRPGRRERPAPARVPGRGG
jgi:hypothetical protein